MSIVAAAGAALLPMPVSAHQNEQLTAGSSIQPSSVQFLFADLQSSLVKNSTTQPPERLERSAAVMAKIATILSIPIVFSTISIGSSPPTLLPALVPYANQRNTILRVQLSPFHDVATANLIKSHHRHILLIAGFTAEIVVLQAALDAIAAGYSVYFLTDAIGSQFDRTEAAAFREMEMAGAKPTSMLSFATRLIPDGIGTPGKQVVAAFQR